jgi:uncharacterized membrane protein YdfJ with MMPL/SSD domain
VTRLLAHLAVRWPRPVVGSWLLLATACVLLSTAFLGAPSNRGFAIEGSASERAAEVFGQHIPGHGGAELKVAVTIRHPRNDWTEQGTRLVQRALGRQPEVRSITYTGAAVQEGTDGEQVDAGIVLVGVVLHMEWAEAESHVGTLREALARADGPRTHSRLLGPPVLAERSSAIARQDLRKAEALALPLTLLVLLVAFQGVAAALLPILLAVVTTVVAFAGLALLGVWINMSVFVTNTATILALGLSVDFSLFMVTRYREELARSGSVEEALTTTMMTTGRAVLLSACTIATSLAALFIVGVSTFSTMAISAGIATLGAAAAALTLLPSTICLAGHRIEWLRIDPVARAATRATLWSWLARVVTGRPVTALFASFAVLVALALPAGSFRLDVHTQQLLPQDDSVRRDMAYTARVLYPGAPVPIFVVTRDDLVHVKELVQQNPGIAQVCCETGGTDGWSSLQAVVNTSSDGTAARHTVEQLRTVLARDSHETAVGGAIARGIDMTERIERRASWAVLVASFLCFATLTWGLRSFVIPLKAVLTTLLSVAATLGLLLRLFHDGAQTPHLEFFVPLFLFAILFGLSIDYEVFLLSRIREAAVTGYEHREAVRRGLVGSARSITLAGVTLTVVFLAFATSRLVPFQQLGVGLALAIVIDITLVRCMLVPAAVVLLRQWNWWWPGRAVHEPSPRSPSAARTTDRPSVAAAERPR